MTFRFSRSRLVGIAAVIIGSLAACQSEDAAERVLSGTVTYRERMALPSDAVVEVSLVDVTQADAGMPVIAATTVRPDGRQVPLPFELQYDPGNIEPDRSYAVRASIRSDSRLLFTTHQAVPVLTQGRPTQADLVLVQAPDNR